MDDILEHIKLGTERRLRGMFKKVIRKIILPLSQPPLFYLGVSLCGWC